MSEKVFASMKRQMVPSDDCIEDLLAKIAALDAASLKDEFVSGAQDELPKDDVLVFKPAKSVGEGGYKSVKTAKGSKDIARNESRNKRGFALGGLGRYGAMALASAVVLVSVFAVIGDKPEDIKNALNTAINDQAVVIDESDMSEGTLSGEDLEKDADVEDVIASDTESKDETSSEGSLAEASDDKGSSATSEVLGHAEDEAVTTEESESVSVKDDKGDETKSGGNASDKDAALGESSDVSDEEKIMPSEASSNELTWTREILADRGVQEITVEGSNYVLDSTVENVSTGSAINTLDLNLPETDISNADTVVANAKQIANVSTDLALAVDVDEYRGTLIYLNSDYSPSSLKQFVKDAGIASGMDCSSVVYTSEKNGYTSVKRIAGDISDELVSCVFSNDAPCTDEDLYDEGSENVVFVSASNPTGTKLSFGISSNGYMRAVMSNESRYTFFIGEECARKFIDSIV